MTTAQTYLELSTKVSFRHAWNTAAGEILMEKRRLRGMNPKNPLLSLVLVSCDGDIAYSKNFKSILYEHIPTSEMHENMSELEELGHYVDLLKIEQTDPKFPAR